jgi:MFS family permease
MPPSDAAKSPGRVVFTYPGFARYMGARAFTVLGLEMQSVAVGWWVYDLTRNPLALGLCGLAQFLPGILLFMVSGHTADRVNRPKLVLCCYIGFTICSSLLLSIDLRGTHSVYPIYGVLVLLGIARSFNGPATRALLPQLLPIEHFAGAVAWDATTYQTATIMGPALGGVMYAAFKGPGAVFATAICSGAVAMLSMSGVRVIVPPRVKQPLSLDTVSAGLRFIWRRKLILGAVSLDLFAVLLGGAVALLPVYARDILRTGPWGLGVLRSAPAIGAASMAMLLANKPLRRRAGAAMLLCVGGFGAFTIVFGLSRSLPLSVLALLFVGAADMVSVVTRGTLVQLSTPDEMRGRVNAVEMIFIGASNELGQFESGLTAGWFGTVPAVVLGGAGAILITGLWAWAFPDLRNAEQPTNPTH